MLEDPRLSRNNVRVPRRDNYQNRPVLSATIHPDIKRILVTISERTGMSVSQVTDEVLYTGLIEMQELWGVGSPLATSADGYFRYIAESVVNADFTEAKRNRQDAKKVLYSAFYRYTLYGKNAREHFWVVSNYVNGE